VLSASAQAVAHSIDQTLLRPDATQKDIEEFCAEAREYPFASLCIHPYWVPFVVKQMEGSNVPVCTVIGFPLGANSTAMKLAEAEEALAHGASEIDMVLNLGELCGGNTDAVVADIKAVVAAAHRASAYDETLTVVKVILETALLTGDQKRLACRLAEAAGAHFVKTSTGFAASGATVADVALMRATVGDRLGVKASGGIRTLADLRGMVAAGANRIGTSAGVKIVQSAISESAESSAIA
jgi:deoxyribose-phosphate aldolase